jgi:hypothetical protein
MAMQHRFQPEQFVLDPKVTQFQLDQEVAARIANRLYADDPATHNGNNWAEPLVIVDPTGETATHGVYKKETDPESDKGYRISLEAEETDNVNQLFAREVRTGFLANERRHRLGWAGSLIITGGVVGVFEGGPIDVALSTDLPALSKAELIATGTFVTGLMLKHMPGHLHRLNVIRPGSRSNERHLKSAEKIADELDLPPVISPSRPVDFSKHQTDH